MAVAFLFPGQGSQRPRMGEGAHSSEPTFRRELDRAAGILSGLLGTDLLEVIRSGGALDETRFTQPALFAVEHALARLWISWGLEPAAMLGHSIGEYVAACLSGVLSLEDASFLVAERGRLMQSMPAGSMLAAALSEDALLEHLTEGVSIASVNGPEQCVASGPSDSIAELESRLAQAGIACKRLRTSHAFHSPMMEGALAPFLKAVRSVDLNPPQRPYLSNVTGAWIQAEEATDPSYWVEHLRRTVRLSAGLEALVRSGDCIALEVGPGRTFAPLTRSFHLRYAPSLPQGDGDDSLHLRACLGRLWAHGARVDWSAVHGASHGASHGTRARVPLPTYPFQRVRCWVGDLGHAPGLPEPKAARREREPASLLDAVASVWRECLGLDEVAPSDDFFDLGGSSLLAIQVRSRLESRLAIDLSMADVLEATRLEELVRRVELAQKGSPATRSPLVRLGTRGTPLYCVHGLDGDVLAFAHLARALDGELSLVALRAHGLEAGETPLGDVREIALRYAKAVRKAASGPYHLAGHSFGALVAFEMARILRELGSEVASLALLDARLASADASPSAGDAAELMALAREHLRRLGLFEDAPGSERRLAVILAHARAAQRHRPLDWQGDALLLLARGERTPPSSEVAERWRSLVRGELRVASTDGDHHSMLVRPHVEGVARTLVEWAGSATLSTHSIQDP
jgi:malonyl CoA-acyl carrier protein transacylase